jgi:hypothetical protein
MPANPKYLSTKWQRFAKITAALIGGYALTISFHLLLASWFDHIIVIITMTFSAFIMWVALMIIAFLAKNGWKIWGIYLLFTSTCSAGIYLTQLLQNPLP